MNPFLLGLNAMSGATNPDAFAQAMAAAGMSPDSAAAMGMGGEGLGSYLLPGLAKAAQPVAAQAAATGALPPAAPGSMNPALLQAMGQVKAPEAVKPIMNAGVSGSQQAPVVRAGGFGGAPGGAASLAQLMMQGGGSPLRVPDLGQLLAGIR